ncbi:type IV secretory system conjugative DNA transfer family protein [Candidatus Uhrbacteria bacterium]|nr:type IV secretory system conjugative DNA transfer family protein [Candidatus Uhrbacteria bacterium]
MKNQALLRIRFPYEDSVPSVVARVKKFETIFYSMFHLLVRRPEVASFEMALINGAIDFYIVVPKNLMSSITSLIFSDFPDAEVNDMPEYHGMSLIPLELAAGFEGKLIGSEAFILRTANKLQDDPLNAFFNFISDIPVGDALVYQVIIDPIDESFSEDQGSSLYGGGTEKSEVSEVKLKFRTSIRLVYFTADAKNIKNASIYIENAFAPFATERNYIKVNPVQDTQKAVDDYFNHVPVDSGVFTTEELASLFHSPNPQAKVRGVDWLFSRKAEAPMNLPTAENTKPEEISIFGVTDFRGKQITFGIRREDRRRHLYIAGKSGSGKSKLLEKLIADDIKAHKGVCVIDPHGDLIQALFYHVPASRIEDVVYFSPSDMNFPIAFNPLENVSREFKQQVTQGLIEIFHKFFGADWTPKIEHVFRFTVLALLDFKKATLMGMQKMLTDRAYRQMVIAEIQDHVVKKFWANEFSSWSEKFDNEAIVPLINKLGQFLSNEMVRNIVAQPKNKVDFDAIMNKEKILFVELSKGKLGEENSSLLGSLLITKIEQQGMARAFIAQQDRKDFYLYVDEFQNFATKTFDNIFSEARKYRLDLTVSHQYLGQLSDSAKQTIFGNVGSMITFRMGADDGKYLSQEFAPRFSANDIMNLGVREMYVKISIDGATTPAFSAKTVRVDDPDYDQDLVKKIIDASRRKFATPVEQVEKDIEELYENFAKQAAAAQAKAGSDGKGGKSASAAAPAAATPAEEETFEAPLV